MKTTIKDAKTGELIRLKANGPVWIKNHYDRETKKYSLTQYEDTNREIFRKGSTEAFTGFTY